MEETLWANAHMEKGNPVSLTGNRKSNFRTLASITIHKYKKHNLCIDLVS